MKSHPKPINIPADIAACCTGSDHAKRMDMLFRTVISTPRAEIKKREADWKKLKEKKAV